MGVVSRSLRLLFPRGLAWRLPGQLGQLVDAIALSIDHLRLFALDVVMESLPGTANETLPDWYATADLPYDASLPLAARQVRLATALSATGGQSFGYLQDQLQAELPDTYLTESGISDPAVAGVYGVGRYGLMRYGNGNPLHTFWVQGFVGTTEEYDRMLAILARIFPLHLGPMIGVSITSLLGYGRSGIAKSGTSRSGNT